LRSSATTTSRWRKSPTSGASVSASPSGPADGQ
jgi:hypothetical protein